MGYQRERRSTVRTVLTSTATFSLTHHHQRWINVLRPPRHNSRRHHNPKLHLLKPIETRHWLQPVAHTSTPLFSFGRPWEINTLPASAKTPTTEIYAKEGNIEIYSSYLALTPDFRVRIAVLQADSVTSPVPLEMALVIAGELVDTLQEVGQAQAHINTAGSYTSLNNLTTLVLIANDGMPGLAVTEFYTNGLDLRVLYASFSDIEPGNISLRLYPTNLGQGNVRSFRSVLQNTSVVDDGSNCMTWSNVDSPTCGGIALDEFLLNFGDDAGVESIKMAALGVHLFKV